MIPVLGNAVSYDAPGGDTSAPSGATTYRLHAAFTASTTLPCIKHL